MTVREHRDLEKRWNEVAGLVRDRWPELTKTDIRSIDGDSRRLIALVHQKTGGSLPEIEDAIDIIAQQSDGLLSQVQRAVRDLPKDAQHAADSVSESVREAGHSVAENFNSAYDASCRSVRKTPFRFLGSAFAVGAAVGLFAVSSMTRSPNRHQQKWNSWN